MTEQEKILRSKQRTKQMHSSFKYCVDHADENVIISPIYLSMPRVNTADKKCALNLNSYRNRQFHMSNQLKKSYKELMYSQLKGLSFSGTIGITYTLYYSHKSDLMNVVSVVDKFFCDALQEENCISDDNVDVVTEIHSVVGGKDKEHPRIEITIL